MRDLDGQNDAAVNEYDLDVAIPVPQGKHEIGLDNSGNDWFTFDSARFTNAVLKISKARSIGLSNETFAMVWIQNKDHTWWNVVNGIPVETLARIDLELLGFINGEYVVEWWNTYTGEMIKQETVHAVDGKIPLPVEQLYSDMAAKVYITEQ